MKLTIVWRRLPYTALLLGLLGLLGPLVPQGLRAHDETPAPTVPQRVLRATAAWPIDSFTLVDQHGKPFTQDRLMGRWTFVVFGDGSDSACAEPCTRALAALDGVLRRIARAEVHKVTQVLFVPLDAPTARPDRLRATLAPYDPRFVAGMGTRATVERLIDDWRVGKDDAAAHTGSLRLLSPDGSVRAEYLPPFDVPSLTADFLKMRARGGGP